MRLLLIAACVLLPACGGSAPQAALLAGETMGSAWTVKIAGDLPLPEAQLHAGIQAQFDAVDAALSTYRADSSLSRFNAASHGQWQELEPELFEVLRYALELAQVSGGAYDPTVAPLVDLWGFGPDPERSEPPGVDELARARALVGWRLVELDVTGHRARHPPGVRVDLSSLGKGRGVDRVGDWLRAQGVEDFLIDLSGKLLASGRNAGGAPWRVAVERPEADSPAGEPNITQEIVGLGDQAIATAGDYRQYFQSGGRRYSHLIDPVSGMPIAHDTGSATVIAGECMVADAWATVLMLLPHQRALALADQYRLPAVLIVRDSGGVKAMHSGRWPD